jgi:hypothetical protein
VFLSKSSSLSIVKFSFPISDHLEVRGPAPCLVSLASKQLNWCMKLALISRSGLLELRNSRVLRRFHRYFFMKNAARTQDARLYPLTECTSTLSVFSIASSMKLKISFATSSLGSKITYSTLKSIGLPSFLNQAKSKSNM